MDTTELATRIATQLLTTFGDQEGTRLEIKQWQYDGTEKSLGGWCKEALVRVIKEELERAS